MKKALLSLAVAALATTGAFAQKTYNEVFPADFSKGLPTGWAFGQDATYEVVDGGLKVTCSQSAPKYRADLKYNMIPSTSEADYFTIDASNYKVFAIKFIGTRPTSGNIKLQNISVNGAWIGNSADYGLRVNNNQYNGDIEDAEGNHTYYWELPGEMWTGTLTINKIEMVIADITSDEQKSYTIAEINWYKDVDALKATIETEPVVINTTTNVKYDNFLDAYNAAVTDDVLSIVAPEVVINDRIAMKSITLEGATGNEKMVQNFNNKLLFNTGSNSNMTFKGLVFEALQGPGNQAMFEHNASNKTSHVLTFDKVKFNNISSSSTNGLINVKRGVLALNDVTFDGCAVSNANGFVNINDNNMLRLSGAVEGLEVNLTAYNSIEASNLTNATPIKLTLSDELLASATEVTRADEEAANVIVIGDVDPAKFEINKEGYKLASDGNGNLILTFSTGIEETLADGNAPVEYFNLQGIKVANPGHGIFIKRQGNKITKVIL